MKIKRVYIGGWFQRTTLHLSEIYDFLRTKTSGLKLDEKKLQFLHANLGLDSTELKVEGLETIHIRTKSDIAYKICEDGLIVLERDYEGDADLAKEIKELTSYYEDRLSPAINYLFSLGAPVPKELANIKTIYPYFVVVDDASREDIDGLLKRFKEHEYFEVRSPHFELYRGDKFYIINAKDESLKQVERFIEEQIFLREFKGQMHRYLNLHRIIWEKIDEVKERGSIKGKDIGEFNDKLQGYAKTINLIGARINQMGTYLSTRERIVQEDKQLKDFLGVLGYRYEAFSDTLDYLKEIWDMTKNYVDSGIALFSDLQEQATQHSVESLTVVTSMGVGATLIGLFTSDQPTFTAFGFYYFIILAAVGFGANRMLGWFYDRKKYEISSVDYDKNIK